MRPVEEELAIAVGDLSVLVDGDLIGWGAGNSIPARSAQRQRTWFSVGGSLGCAWLRPCRGREHAVFEALLSLTVPAVRASPAGLLSGLGAAGGSSPRVMGSMLSIKTSKSAGRVRSNLSTYPSATALSWRRETKRSTWRVVIFRILAASS
jgi:hypothetical protein